ncbi:MAG: TonB-dependent receptor domain-containing protein [Emticicia sp.]|uniref:TonB-dependent receptor n=1 Tax=Emticicia sp. TaxID=1930953 RepID=UPI003BA439E4
MRKSLLKKGFWSVFILTIVNLSVFAQSTKVSGKVTDEKNQALVGVSVVVKGTTKGTISDADGSYSIEASGNQTLSFSFVGYTSKEVAINNQSTVNVALAEDAAALDEVVVTGVFDKRTRLESSVAISTLSAKQLDRIVPNSGIDMLKNIPGVYVNSSKGEVSGSLNTRGLSIGDGFFYVSMQEDGLPILAAQGSSTTNPNYKPDGFLRADASINRIEAVRGGTASILGANAPGGIFNYVSKEGGRKFEGEVRTRFGLEGNGQNPLYRTDLNFGGPLSKDKSITYNVGGFYRYANGPKYPGYPLSRGGQFKGNIVKNYKSGSIKLYAKFLNDRTAPFEFTPTVDFANPRPVSGFDNSSSTMVGPISYTIPGSVWGRTGSIDYDSRNVSQFIDRSIGLNWTQDLGKGWTFNNNGKFARKDNVSNLVAVVFPFRVDQATFYGVGGNIPRFGTYEFINANTGQSYGTAQQLPPAGGGLRFLAGSNLNLPGKDVLPNAVFYTPLAYNDIKMNEFIDQMTITKKLKNMTFTGGAFIANLSLLQEGAGPSAQVFSTVEDKPQPLRIKYTNLQGQVFDLSDSKGITNIGGNGVATNDAKVATTAFFGGQNWDINKKLTLDWGIRYERFNIDVTNTNPKRNPDLVATGGADGKTSTLYDVRSFSNDTPIVFGTSINTFSFSAGLNYKITDNMAVYARYSNGKKSPDMSFYLDVANQRALTSSPVEAQDIKMAEVALKVKTNKTTLFITPFFNNISNVPNFQIFQNTDLTFYGPPRQYQQFRTQGIELEANHSFTKNFSLRAAGTFQGGKALVYSVYLAKANGPADDEKITYDGNFLDNVAPVMLMITPTYSTDKFYASIAYQYMGARWANVANAFKLPAFGAADLNMGYNITKKLTVSASINNLLNTYGVMSWAAPGGFPASLDTQGFTKAAFDANVNSVYSTLPIMPRAYFISLSYKF